MALGGFQLPQLDPSMSQPMSQPVQMPPPPKKKGGMFGSGLGIGEALILGLNGYLAGRGNPIGMANLQMYNQRQERADEAAKEQQKREEAFQDFVRKEAWQRANPGPTNNDTVADYNFWKSVLPPAQFEQYVESKVNPPQLMNVPGVGIVQVPRMGGGQAPTAPVGRLTPIDDGGPTPPASGGFPRSY